MTLPDVSWFSNGLQLLVAWLARALAAVPGLVPRFDPGSLSLSLRPELLIWPVLFGFAAYLMLQAQPIGRPKPDLAELLQRLDVDERMRAELGRAGAASPIFASRLLEGLLRPLLDDVGRFSRVLLGRIGLGGGDDLDVQLPAVRPGVNPGQFFGEKVATGLIGLLFFPLLNLADITLAGPWPVWTWLVTFALGFFAPDWNLTMRLAARRTQVVMELPTILDMLTIAASAGLGLEQALVQVARLSSGVVATELHRTAREMALGESSLVEALDRMAIRCAVPELSAVLTQLRAVHEQGLPLVAALASQAEALRERQRLRIIEEGHKAGVRMLLPVGIFILPVLFVVVLVPAVLQLGSLAG